MKPGIILAAVSFVFVVCPAAPGMGYGTRKTEMPVSLLVSTMGAGFGIAMEHPSSWGWDYQLTVSPVSADTADAMIGVNALHAYVIQDIDFKRTMFLTYGGGIYAGYGSSSSSAYGESVSDTDISFGGVMFLGFSWKYTKRIKLGGRIGFHKIDFNFKVVDGEMKASPGLVLLEASAAYKF